MTTTKTADYEQIETGMINPEAITTAGNFRSHYDKASLKELAASIAQYGVLQPVICRPYTEAEKETLPGYPAQSMILAAGARRLQAAKMAGVEKIPYRLLNLTQEQGDNVQMFENLHRDNISTMDEARAFKTLLEQGRYTKHDLADKVNKSISYVTKAITLCDLPEAAIKALDEGILTPSHCHQILRVPTEKQAEVVEFATKKDYSDNYPTLRELIRHLDAEFGRQLDTAVFPQDCDYADRPACEGCQQNSANQTLLFAEAEAGACMNPDCYAAKVAAFDAQVADEAATKYKGMKCLGTKTPKYNCNGHLRAVGKGVVVEAELAKNPEIKKAMKAAPEKFAYAVDANTHRTILVLQDAEMIAALKKNPATEEAAKNSLAQEILTRCNAAAANALYAAAIKARVNIGKEEVLEILDKQWGDTPGYEAFGVTSRDYKSLLKLSLQELLLLTWFNCVNPTTSNFEKFLTRQKINVKAIKKLAYKEVKDQMAVEQAAAAEAKQGKKAKGGEEETEGEE